MAQWYIDWFNSPFYHKLYFDRDEQEAGAFMKNLLLHLRPSPASLMLDVACGKGRHSRFLASQGFDVTGIDLSFDSIRIAKQFENDRLHFYQHDMRLTAWINYFDYAFNLFSSFGYFATRREHDDAMRTVANSLKSNGVFVIDYLNVHYVEDHLNRNEIRMIDETQYEIHRWTDEDHFFKKITVTDPSLQKPFTCTEKLARFSLGDFTDMLSFQKMQVIDVFGDYELNPYDVRSTPRLVIIARKS
jgi:SAM-dependent methyltransferase